MAGGGLKALLKGGAKIFSKVLLPIQAFMSIFDFMEGFKGASDIVGIDTEKLTLLQKLGAGLSSVVSGLTFGLLDAKSVFHGFSGLIGKLFTGPDAVFGGLVQIFQNTVLPAASSLFNLVKEGLVVSLGTITTTLTETILPALGTGFSLATDGLKAVFGTDGLLVKGVDGIKSVGSFISDAFVGENSIFAWFGSGWKTTKDTVTETIDNMVSFFDNIFGEYLSSIFLQHRASPAWLLLMKLRS